MKQFQEKILQYLTGEQTLETVTVADLQRISDEHPYFPVTQFLLAKRLKTEDDSVFIEQAQKTALYFSNPFWLDLQLQSGSADDSFSLEKEILKVGNAKEQPVITHDHIDVVSREESGNEENPVTAVFSKQELDAASELAHTTLREPETKMTTEKQIEPLTERVFYSSIENTLQTQSHQDEYTGNDEVVRDNIEQVFPMPQTPLEVEITGVQEEMAGVTRDTSESIVTFLEEATDKDEVVHDKIEEVFPEKFTALEAETTEVDEEMAGVTKGSEESTEAFLKEAEATKLDRRELTFVDRSNGKAVETVHTHTANVNVTHESPEPPDEHERMFQNIKAMLDASSEEADADVKNASIHIDPYYTIDYFASQGIKLELDQNPRDQLGQNLKKFTHWLKQMKKLGPEDATEVISRTETDSEIQRFADSSNTVREVVTEAMAQVLEKQGKKEKAIVLYNKLSFLNPDKSAYFAHKIKNLKGS